MFRYCCSLGALLVVLAVSAHAQQLEPVTPSPWRSQISAERRGLHDANRIRTVFYNFGMVGDFEVNPDLSVFHSVEVPKGIGLNYSDGITPFVLTRVPRASNPNDSIYVMLTGYRERQAIDPFHPGRQLRFEPRPGFFEPDPLINRGRSIAISNDPRTWPGAVDAAGNPRQGVSPEQCWYDKINDPDDPGWCGSWNGYFGKRPNADQESFFVMDDNFYTTFDFYPDAQDQTRRGLGLRVEVRGFQWSNPQAQNVIFWHYDIVNESTTDYPSMIFGLYMDSGVGGSQLSCDGVYESDDDNAFYNTELGLNLVYTWDKGGHGVSLRSTCEPTGYVGYAYLETPGNPFDGIDNDEDGITDERRDSGPGERIEGQEAIRAYVMQHYDLTRFERAYGPLENRPAYLAGVWWTGDEDLDWVCEAHDTGADGIFADPDEGIQPDTGEGDCIPTAGEPNFDRTDITESDQIGLTGFKMNRIRPGAGSPATETDNIVFFMDQNEWPKRLYRQFTHPDPAVRFDPPLVLNYNIGFLFASGPFALKAGQRERFSLALAYGEDLIDLESTVRVVQSIYNANYQFATPPPAPTVQAYAGDGFVTLMWDNRAETAVDPVTGERDFEGYRIYRATDPNFLDAQLIRDARGGGPVGNGRPIAQFDLINGIRGFSELAVQGVQYWLGEDNGIRHVWTDSTVVNGQLYYYAVTAYDRGVGPPFNFYPSENAISVSRTVRGGTILPRNVVAVRPNPSVPGYIPGRVIEGSLRQIAGRGVGTVQLRVVHPDRIPEGHEFRLEFAAPADSIRAQSYRLVDVTTGEVLFENGRDFEGAGTGPVGAGLLPVIQTAPWPEVDTVASGFTTESQTRVRLRPVYQWTRSPNLRRPGYPEDLLIVFANEPLDTSRAAIGMPATPAHFKIIAADGTRQFDFRFRDVNRDRTLSADGEFIEVLLPEREGGPLVVTWRIFYDAARTPVGATPPGAGDVYRLRVQLPLTAEDVFTFTTQGAYVDAARARDQLREQEPYVVPNPYVAAAAFEPERFAVSGRGERRLEFRNIPAGATIRIYTVRGELVQTLHHDGSSTGMVPWNLRTKDNLEIAPGLYLFHVEAPGVGEYIGKFAVIK